ncbi:MAG TPA: divergent PAP2 family protein [Firmicutes bacterium]|uniref:Divergent PAP2 family protein n=1 Tax=Capillibacterium thermochitinicola TaxID=2699427 RepID=A0A8J6I383_9FIRM|nr:divergent PAP2 family protein [Capillibacterium thermochitinicola]MBA2133854.1 divergent PAP2 family protein [Capillibacterium thermochitinicola]HHW11649.1 divergent PAP2 family protein [Bacillota bacterium]
MGGFSENTVFWSAFLAWLVTQVLKGLLFLIKQKKLDFRRFVGAGGMPSSHSAFVSALATGVGLTDGWASTNFALALVFALVVMYDAAGVRLAASKQAQVLNKMVQELFGEREFHHERLKELIGHTPVEVIVGSLLGVFFGWWLVAAK